MRLFLISLAIAIFALLPEAAAVRDWDLPDIIRTIARVPAAGLSYMTVFFHELGHTVTNISYGQLAVPMFNFTDGGGFAQPIGSRSMILQGLVYIAWVLVILLAFRDGSLRLALALVCGLAVHACFAFGELKLTGTPRYELPVNYFGNGGAVVMGCFCIWRSALNKTMVEKNADVERYMHMIFGLFAVLNEGLGLGFELMTDPIARDAYNEGIGSSHIANDFTVIADRLNITVGRVGAFHFMMTLVALAVTGVLIWIGWQEQKADDAEKADQQSTPMVRRQLRK
jgi:hypothetical protein